MSYKICKGFADFDETSNIVVGHQKTTILGAPMSHFNNLFLISGEN